MIFAAVFGADGADQNAADPCVWLRKNRVSSFSFRSQRTILGGAGAARKEKGITEKREKRRAGIRREGSFEERGTSRL